MAQHQHGAHCGVTTADQKAMIQFVEAYKKKNNIDPRNEDLVYVPIKFHLVADDNGDGRINADAVLEQMTVMINDYKAVGMYLYIEDESFSYIDNTSIYSNPSTFELVTKSKKDGNSVNIFICENANTPSGQGTTLGYYSPSGDFIIVRKQDVNNATSTLSHELGHFFSLPHTFYGWEGGWNPEDFNGQVSIMFAPGTSIPVELVDGSNCDVAADRICDTPPDYNFGFGVSGCTFNETVLDKNGDLIDPMEENFMGYFIGCDEYEWTPGQVDVMRDNFFSPLRGNINLDFIPDTTHIENTHEFITPNAAETLEYYDNVFVDWTDAENANNYLVIISNSSEYHEYYTTESEIYVNDLSPDGIYFVKVKPFNDGYTDTDIINRLFRTGDLLSSSQESSILKSLNVFPNPAQTGQALNIEVNIEKSIETSIDIINMQGQRVYSQVRNLQQGANQISIETPNMPAGLYMLNIETEDGAVQRKIIIQ